MFRTTSARALIAGAFVVALSACGTSADGGASDAASQANFTGNLSGEITVWTWDGAPGTATMQKMASAFKKKTGVTVKLAALDRDNYVAQSQLALNSGNRIDVLGIQPSLSAQDVAKKMIPVSQYQDQLEKGLDGYSATSLEQLKKIFPGDSVYSVPFASTGSAVCFYNGDILSEVGLKPPQTWADVSELSKVLAQKKPGVLSLVMPADTWFQDEFVLTMVGQKAPNFYNSVRYDDGAWNAPAYVDGLARYGELYADGTLPKGTLDLPYGDAMNTFNTGKAAIVCNGSWEAGLLRAAYRKENAIKINEVGVIPVPADSAADQSLRSFLDITWGIPTTSGNPAAAAAFISWATQGDGIDLWADGLGFIPAAKDWTLKSDVLGDDPVAAKGYETLQALVAKPSSDRNNLSSFSAQAGSYDLEVAQGRMTAKEAADKGQKDLKSGLYK